MQSGGLDINDLVKEAQTRWLKPAEVFSILQNHENYQLAPKAPDKPTSGSLFLFNKRILRFFRRDGHNWRKKKDGRTVGEAHERLKVGNIEALNCYYAHGEDNPNFQRRCYWMLDLAFEHIVLVHYRDISEGKHISGSISQLSPGSYSTLIQSPTSCTNHNPHSFSVASGVNVSYQNQSSPGPVEVSSEIIKTDNGIDYSSSSSDFEVSQALRKLKEQLSLNDDSYGDIGIFLGQDDSSEVPEYERESNLQYDGAYSLHEHAVSGMYIGSNNIVQHQDAGKQKENEWHTSGDEYIVNWVGRLDSSKNSPGIKSQDNSPNTMGRNETPLCSSGTGLSEELGNCHWLNFSGNNSENASVLLPQGEDNFHFPYSFGVNYPHENNPDYSVLFGQSQLGIPPEADSSLTIAQTQKFSIREISPEWGYVSEVTKVIIIGSFLCNPSECAWACMFGNIEVPFQIIQEGVIICEAPPCLPGKVTLCITSGNRESCSEVREFEFRAKPTSCSHSSITQAEVKSSDELLLLVRFVQMFLSDALIQKSDSTILGVDVLRKFRANDEAWDQVIEALLVGSGVSSVTVDWLLQELLKDKLLQWISYKSLQVCDPSGCFLSRKEQGIIHMVAGLGFVWALNPVLSLGVGINFRDINGWTALHWAARFGREKMVAALIASGASAGVVTDPNSQDLTGKTPASIAANSGHKGLAGYLSELALTTHLSSLKVEESELSKGSAEVEAEITVSSISKGNFTTCEDQLSLKDTLAAVRNAAQAAARIQSAFRAHSFRRRQLRTVTSSCDEYGISPYDAQELSAILSKLAFRNARDYNSAALSIQKKYRGWKGRKDFLAFRQKVVKIQAHVRGHQVRKNYQFCWAVSILDKVILRWRRRGVGLRGFRPEVESLEDSEDEEDIVKVFRRQKVDATIDEAVSSVLSMVESPDARQQYRRMLQRYRQAKADLVSTTNEAASTSQNDVFGMDKDDMYLFS